MVYFKKEKKIEIFFDWMVCKKEDMWQLLC